ncbi:beta-xyloside ABC transporter [Mesobacillus boroniphilus JCM 21738]|uniref:Beta-xyloside ABC transporter n=1 Tax=Mesobacillus boroniphilus JCM 21738 TaxID=1294265 RepID=W4RQ18_9BACI|nr:beta-xyloside ABC transporter [Mesobacillus boroniphilus JCM 21738]
MFIFNYIPMYGLIIAFKEYSIIKTISEAPWVGLMQFKEFLQDENFWIVLKNTLGISLIKLIIGFPLPIIFALLLNELTSMKLKKAVQTISYLPHFISWVVLGGILTTWLADIGVLNDILLGLGLISERTNFLASPDNFWLSSFSRIYGKNLDGQQSFILQQLLVFHLSYTSHQRLTEQIASKRCGMSHCRQFARQSQFFSSLL